MKSLLSRLTFWWAALAASLAVLLPAPLGTWVAALAVAAAALSLLLGRAGPHPHPHPHEASRTGPGTASAVPIEDSGLLETVVLIVRCAAHARDLPAALHGVARVLVQELGADGLTTGRIDPAGRAPLQQPLATTMSAIAAQATLSQRVKGSAEAGYAVPVSRNGLAVAWLEFKTIEMPLSGAALLHLLELVRIELTEVAERGVRPRAGAAPELPPLLTRYPRGASPDSSSDGVLDQATLNRLSQLDPNGVNRLLERVVTAFDHSTQRLIPQLQEGARRGDLDGVRQVARTLRSASASIGAVRLTRLCADIEADSRAGQPCDLATRVKSMAAETDIALSVLRSLAATRT